MKYTFLFLSLFFVSQYGFAQSSSRSYAVEKVWGVQFKIPDARVGNVGNSYSHFWLMESQNDKEDFEFDMLRTKPKKFKKKYTKFIENSNSLNAEQKDRLLNQPQEVFRNINRFGIKMQYAEFNTSKKIIIFTFEHRGEKYIGSIETKKAKLDWAANLVFSSIQPSW